MKNTDVEADDVVAGGGDVERERGTVRRRRQTEVRAVTKQIGRRLSPSRDQERPRVVLAEARIGALTVRSAVRRGDQPFFGGPPSRNPSFDRFSPREN